MSRIPVLKPATVPMEALRRRIDQIDTCKVFSNRGPQVVELEQRIATYLGVPSANAVICANATLAIEAAVIASGVRSWRVQGWTFPATVLAALSAGVDVKLVDIDENSWTSRVSKDMPGFGWISVPPFGASIEGQLLDITSTQIIDAAASLPSSERKLESLSPNTAVVFSLHATKLMGGGEGGIVVFGDEEKARFARAWINFGFEGQRESSIRGTNGKMSEFDAAVINARLDGWNLERLAWLDLKARTTEISERFGICPPPVEMQALGPYWVGYFGSQVIKEKVRERLEYYGIESRDWWGQGLHRMPAFRDLASSSLPNVARAAQRSLGLPFHLFLDEAALTRITQVLDSCDL